MIQVICFSKDRPLQLHGYLTSVFEYFPSDTRVKVLVQAQPQWFADAYAQVEAEFPQVAWCHERDFRNDLEWMVGGDAEYTVFGCDDVVYTRRVGVPEFHPDWLCISLRLGRHVIRDMFGNPMPQPKWDAGELSWSIYGSQGDWAYPWEVLGTIYKTQFAQRMVARIGANSPSQLEARGALCWAEETDKRTMAYFWDSRLVVPTVNLVQTEYPNGICGRVPLDVGFLLDSWNHGMRLDVDAYADSSPDSWRIPDFYLKRAA